MDAIKTIDVCKSYGDKDIVKHIDLQVPKGAIYGFIGRNGAGKTTTQKMVCGLARPTAGRIEILGEPLGKVTRKDIGTLIEQPAFYPGMTALENVMMQGYNIGLKSPRAAAIRVLRIVGLENSLNKKAKTFSLGMKQRLGLAIAMLGEPEILVLDEPINGLDPEGIIEFRQALLNLQEKGMTILISSHILGELAKIATHYGIIREGELIRQFSAEELKAQLESYLQVTVANATGAAQVLEEKFPEAVCRVTSEKTLHLYDFKDTGAVNSYLSQKGFVVEEMYRHQQDLESYFIDLMGGSEHASGL